MLVAELRQRLVERVAQISAEGEETSAAIVLAYTRAALVALAQHAGDRDIDLQLLTINTKTAALIVGLHPEYIRLLIRRGRLEAKKENGEYRIALANIAGLAAWGVAGLGQQSEHFARITEMLRLGTVVWANPETRAA